jgi:sugar phosphate isomerase/epimerase
MHPLHCSVPLVAFGSRLKPALKQAAAARVEGVLLDTRHMVQPSDFSASAIRHLRKHLDELGLTLAATTFPTRRGFSDRTDLQPRVEAVCQALTFARALGTNVLTLNIGPIPIDANHDGGQTDEAGRITRDRLVEVLNDLARHGNHVGAIPVIDVSACDLQTFQALLHDIDSGPIGVDFDPAAWTGRGRNPVEAFRELYDVVHHVWAKDALRASDGSYREVAIGQGEVAWDEILAVLAEAEYDGWLTAGTGSGDDPAGDALRAVAMLKSIGTETMG